MGEEVGKKLRGVEGGETATRINCMRKEPIFNKRENRKEGEKKRKCLKNILTDKSNGRNSSVVAHSSRVCQVDNQEYPSWGSC